MAPVAQPQAAPQPSVVQVDSYLDGISNESLEVLHHFGPEAPAQLNTYATRVEDALLEALEHQQNQAYVVAQQQEYINDVQAVLQAAAVEREQLRTILTDPQVLSDYTVKFFGPEGPFPVQTPAEQAQAALAQGMIQSEGPLMPRAENPRMDVANDASFQRPQMPPMPSPSAQAGTRFGGDVWRQFSQLMDVKPEDAWKVLSTASPEDVRTKVLFMEG